MRHHKKTYEDVFSVDHKRNNSRLDLDEITIVEMELAEYTDLFKNFLTDWYSGLFLNCAKLSWLRRKFMVNGKRVIIPMYRNDPYVNYKFVKFMRRNIGKDIQMITRSAYFVKFELYFDEMFPEFLNENPFKNPDYYKFPYENISAEFLLVIYQMDDRLGLLEKANEEKMSFAVFLDYVINHAYTENELLGRQRYEISQNVDRRGIYFVVDTDKKTIAKKGEKRI
jgi:hypothetical protein